MRHIISENLAMTFGIFLSAGALGSGALLLAAWRSRRRPWLAVTAGLPGLLLAAAVVWVVFGGPLRDALPAFELQGQTGVDLSSYVFSTVADGAEHHLSELRGKPVVLYYWSTTCPSCMPSLPVLARLATEFEGRAHIVLLSYEDRETLLRYAEGHPIPGLAACSPDPPVRTEAYPRRLATPVTFLIDRGGIVRKVFLASGGWTPRRLRGLLEEYAPPRT